MEPRAAWAARVNWYHVAWATRRRRRVFKIPDVRRFCERAIQRACTTDARTVDRVRVTADRVQLLVLAAADVPRATLVRELKRAAARAVREVGAVGPVTLRLWEDGAWCVSVRSGPGLEAVRCRLEEG